MNSYALGCMIGIIVGIVVAGITIWCFNKNNKDGKLRCKFDERQQLVRGKGFKYAFFALLIYNVVYATLNVAIGDIPVDSIVEMFIGVCISVGVYVGHCIWNEGYFSLNENPKKVLIFIGVCGALNLIIGIMNLLSGEVIVDGILTYKAINLICAILLLIIVVIAGVKNKLCKDE